MVVLSGQASTRRRACASTRALAWAGCLAAAALPAVIVGCGEAPVPPLEQRTIEDTERAVRYVLPPHWSRYDDEIRSPNGTIFTIEVLSLVDAEPVFRKALPASIVPQLEARTKYFFSVVGTRAERSTTVAGEPALEVTFPIQIRDRDKPSKLVYWVVPVGERLNVLRVTYPPEMEAVDGPAAQEILASLVFL